MRPSELDPERWRRIDEVLDAALEKQAADRAVFLAETCAGDDELLAEVEALLEAHKRAEESFEQPVSPLGAAVVASSEALPENRQVGPFRLLREIGRGGMGVVYLAEDTRLGRYVALKALPPYLGVGQEAKQRFVAEAKAVSMLDHPSIATLYEIDETETGQLYMAFAFYEGETLEARIARGPLPVDEAVGIAIRIAEGLAAAHGREIVHRDVKPSNVLLTAGGEVKLLDFGVAKAAGEDVTGDGVRLGTIAYMSPEQASGDGVDPRTDLWSLGLVLYEMVTGERPFRGADQSSLIQSILHGDPEPPSSRKSEIPEEVDRVVEKLLCKAPEGRYESADELLLDLSAVGTGQSPAVAIREPPPTRVLSRSGLQSSSGSARRWRWRTSSAALLGLAVAAGAVWLAANAFGPAGPRIGRVAVLPLDNLTGDPDQQYFVDGIHEALITDLGKIGSLDIISRTSVMRYRSVEISIPEIAGELEVDAVVEGSVFRSGDSLAITAQLIAASPERQLWGDRYQGSVAGVFEITGEVARAIAAEIEIRLSPAAEIRLATDRRVIPEAYDAYVLGRFYWERRNRDGFDLAQNYFRRAIEIDTAFAPAWAGLADTYSAAAEWGLTKPSESYSRARVLAERALRIDSTLAEAYTALAAVTFFYDWDWAETERLSRRAIELNPSYAQAYTRLAQSMGVMGRRREARATAERARELDRLPPSSGMRTAFSSYRNLDFDRAIESAQAARDFDGGIWQASWLICLSLAGKELHDQAIGECRDAVARFGRNPLVLGGLGYVYALGGRPDEAERVIEELGMLAREMYVGPSLTAIVYAALGDRDRAFEWLDRAYEERDALLVQLKYPFFDPFRDDPRFVVLRQRMGFEP